MTLQLINYMPSHCLNVSSDVTVTKFFSPVIKLKRPRDAGIRKKLPETSVAWTRNSGNNHLPTFARNARKHIFQPVNCVRHIILQKQANLCLNSPSISSSSQNCLIIMKQLFSCWILIKKKGPPVMKLFRYTPLSVAVPASVAKSGQYPRCLCLTVCPSITQSVRLSVSVERHEYRWKNFRKILS